jgi:hypothetical protein
MAGCGKTESVRVAVHPVSGRLLVNGKPAERAVVSLNPSKPFPDPTLGSVLPYGLVQADGTFSIGTYTTDDGAPVGEYTVTVVWPTITIEGGEEIFGQDRLRKAFENPKQPATKFAVKDGENLVPTIDLKVR